ncbi:MAG: Hsp70 family protein, partial [Desulfitobacterium sp.]|nr:Hsp70 family protein [Desulfitobacterium sp.]
LSEEEIEKMKKDAEMHAEEDKKRKELIDAKNEADSMVYQTEKTLNDFEGKISDSEVEPVKKALEELKTAAAGEDVAEIKEKTEAVTKVLYPIIEKMYQQAGPQAGPDMGANPEAGGAGPDDNVVDAEYTEVDKDDK